MADWQIAEAAEARMKTVYELTEELGLERWSCCPTGTMSPNWTTWRSSAAWTAGPRQIHRRDGDHADAAGGGKSTTPSPHSGDGPVGQARDRRDPAPSSGPTSTSRVCGGGGLSQCIPLAEFSLGLTGDFDAVNNAHNLAMVALTSRLQHEFNYTDEVLSKKKLKRLNIDPRNIAIKWTMDYCAQALRDIVIGLGDKMDGFMLSSGFQIAVSSELMAILSVATSLRDLRERIARWVVAYDKWGNPVTTADLEVTAP
jgi:formate--tetrahydrofolate ligase